jgi:hypothetical protein
MPNFLDELFNFIMTGKNIDYSQDDESSFKREINASTTITATNGKFRSEDNYFGGEPYGGREIIFYEDKPVWIMVYYGLIHPGFSDINKVYATLKKALREGKSQKLFRGPTALVDKGLVYKAVQKGDVSNIQVDEFIYQGNKEIYCARFIGGLVDQRKE